MADARSISGPGVAPGTARNARPPPITTVTAMRTRATRTRPPAFRVAHTTPCMAGHHAPPTGEEGVVMEDEVEKRRVRHHPANGAEEPRRREARAARTGEAHDSGGRDQDGEGGGDESDEGSGHPGGGSQAQEEDGLHRGEAD